MKCRMTILMSYFPCFATRFFPREDCSILPFALLFAYLWIWNSLIRITIYRKAYITASASLFIKSSSISQTPNTAAGSNRGTSAPEDPWIGLKGDGQQLINTNTGDRILYGKNERKCGASEFFSSYWYPAMFQAQIYPRWLCQARSYAHPPDGGWSPYQENSSPAFIAHWQTMTNYIVFAVCLLRCFRK